MSYPVLGNVYLGSVNLNYQPKRWFMTCSAPNNGYTKAGFNLGSFNGRTSNNYWNTVSVSGGAISSAWNITNGIFTAPENGQYTIQLNVFINSTTTTGKWMELRGNISFGIAGATGQYGTFNERYLLGDNGTNSVFYNYWVNSGETFYFYCNVQTPALYFANSHTDLIITKIL